MAEVKKLLCLANSRKLSGRCVAGKDLGTRAPGSWVRPVSDRPFEEVSERERQYQDGSDPRVLDIIEVPLKHAHPNSFQSENWLLDPRSYWVRVGRAKFEDLAAFTDDPPILWVNNSSTRKGLNDRVSVSDAEKLDSSLYLLSLDNMKLYVFAPGEDFGNPKRRVQADFVHRGVRHQMWVTDPVVTREYLARGDGEYEIGGCFVTVSLGEPHEGYCYKLVATLMTKDRAED